MPSFAPLSPLPFLSPYVFVSPCHSCSFAGWWEASEGMSKRHLRRVCERHSVISVGSDVSLRACLWSYQQPRDNRWWRRKEGKHPEAGWQRGEVTAEQEHRGVRGSEGRAWSGSSDHVGSFKPCFYFPPLSFLPVSPSPKSFCTCRASSSRSALTGPSCVLALWPTALFDFVCMCAIRGGVGFVGGTKSFFSLKGLIFVAGLSDLRSLHDRSTPALSKWQRLTRATGLSDGCPPRRGICSVKEQAGATDWCARRVALRRENAPFTVDESFSKL